MFGSVAVWALVLNPLPSFFSRRFDGRSGGCSLLPEFGAKKNTAIRYNACDMNMPMGDGRGGRNGRNFRPVPVWARWPAGPRSRSRVPARPWSCTGTGLGLDSAVRRGPRPRPAHARATARDLAWGTSNSLGSTAQVSCLHAADTAIGISERSRQRPPSQRPGRYRSTPRPSWPHPAPSPGQRAPRRPRHSTRSRSPQGSRTPPAS